MTIIAQGVDLIACSRIEDVLRRHGVRFLDRVLTPAEREYVCAKKFVTPHLAGRFAAKEAVLKVLGTGWRGAVAWTDVEIVNDRAGQPVVRLSGACQQIAASRRITRILVSISHTQEHAVATALGVSDA